MRASNRRDQVHVAGVLAALVLIAAGCTGAAATTAPASSSTRPVILVSLPDGTAAPGSTAKPSHSPVFCEDGQDPGETMPADCVMPGMPTGLATPRPVRDEPSPGPTAARPNSPEPSDPSALSEEGTNYFRETLAAGKSITIPIDFEGSSWGWLTVYTTDRQGTTTTTFGGKKGTPQPFVTGTSTLYDFGQGKPVNGTLAITNSGTTVVDVSGFVYIQSRRHLIVDMGSAVHARGQPVTVRVLLTDAVDADDVKAEFVHATSGEPNPTDAVASPQAGTPITMTRTSTGQWTGTFMPSEAGTYDISVETTGSRIRASMVSLIASDADVTVSSSSVEKALDLDHDRLIDELDLIPTITAATAGMYQISGSLVDSAGVQVASGGIEPVEVQLQAGVPTPVTIKVNGNFVWASQRWGPYELHVSVERKNPWLVVVQDAVVGKTAPYDYLQFRHDRIAIDAGSFRAVAVDTDGDGRFEGIEVTGSVTVDVAYVADIGAGLGGGSPWQEFALTRVRVQLAAGKNSFKVLIKGSDIAKSGRDGPYEIVPIEVFPVDGEGYAWGSPVFTTPAYKASQFH